MEEQEKKKKNFFKSKWEDLKNKRKENKEKEDYELLKEKAFEQLDNVHFLTIHYKKSFISDIVHKFTNNKVPAIIEDTLFKTNIDLNLSKIDNLTDDNKNRYFITKKEINTENINVMVEDKEETIKLYRYKYVDKIEEVKPTIQVVNQETKIIDKSKSVNNGIIGDNNTQNIEKNIGIKANIGKEVNDQK